MRLATYRFADGVRVARIDGPAGAETVGDLGLPTPLVELLSPDSLAALAMMAPVAEARLDQACLLPPIPAPPLFLGVGLNYRDHAAEIGRSLPDTPALFIKAPAAIAPPFGTISSHHESLDYEGELGVVIGTPAFRASADTAMAHVAGYVIVNDITVRALIRPDNLVLGKGGAGHGPFGPWLTTADAVPDPHDLAITTHVNDERRQQSRTSQLHRTVPQLIAWISQAMVLPPGTIIATGSPAGSGAGSTPPRWLAPGDTVRVAIERLGHIEHRVTA